MDDDQKRIKRFLDSFAEDTAVKLIYGNSARSPFLKWWIANKAAYPTFGAARDAWDTLQARGVK